MAVVRKFLLCRLMAPSRKKGGPKRTLIEAIKIDLKKCSLLEDLAHDRLERQNRINVAEPNIVGMRL